MLMAATNNISAQPSTTRSWTAVSLMPADFAGADLSNLAPAQFPAAAFAVKDPAAPAVLTSPETPAAFPFDQLLFSADALLPGGGSMEAEAQVKTEEGWSGWFSFGRLGPEGGASVKSQQTPFGRMDVDLLRLEKKASAYRYRVTLRSGEGSPASLRLAAVTYTDSTAPYVPAEAEARPAGFAPLAMELPAYSQMIQQVNYAGDICSPVSLSMVLTSLGVKAGPIDTAAAVRDAGENIYGNWFLNTAYAGSRGVYAFIARLNSLEDARAFLEAGAPVIASVTFGPGELENAPLLKTKGHLLVISGFTAKGDVIVHDPAAPDEKTVKRVYKRAQFAAAWLNNKLGTCYVVASGLDRLMTVKDKVAELYSAPPADDPADRKRLIETQLVFNERAELLEIAGGWARVKAPEQKSLKQDNKTLTPYEGWLPLAALGFGLPAAPTAVVKAKTAKASGEEISMGVKLRVIAGGDGAATALPAHGEPLLLSGRDLNQLGGRTPAAELRRKVLDAARVFLGDKYYWGGRSAWGVDCSGLVNLSFRAWGVDLPRNAGDQFAAARTVAPAALKPGDLIFSSDAARPAAINHVMIYSGGGMLIEATQDSGDVREVTFAEKFGADFKKARNGMTSRGKKIFFRRVIN